MLNDWFYSHSSWTVMFAVCSVIVGLSLAGLYGFNRLVDPEKREPDTSMVGLSYALAGGIYAIVISFVAVGVYESLDKADGIASAEANSLNAIMFDSAGLPADSALNLRRTVHGYIDVVTKKEWPSQQAFHMEDSNFEAGWALARQLSDEIVRFQPATQGQETVKAELLGDVTELFSERHERILAAGEHLPDAIWQAMIFGLLLIAVYVYLFGPHSFKMHMAVTGLTMFTIGLVFSLIIAMDYPFRGDVSVDDEAYTSTAELGDALFGPSTNADHTQR